MTNEEKRWLIDELSVRLDSVMAEIYEEDRKHHALEEELMKIAEEWREQDCMAIMGNNIHFPDKRQIIAILIGVTGKTSSKDLEMFSEIADEICYRSLPRS